MDNTKIYNPVLNRKELAEYLHVPVDKIRKLIVKEKLPFLKVGSEYRFFKPEIDKWLLSKMMVSVNGVNVEYAKNL